MHALGRWGENDSVYVVRSLSYRQSFTGAGHEQAVTQDVIMIWN